MLMLTYLDVLPCTGRYKTLTENYDTKHAIKTCFRANRVNRQKILIYDDAFAAEAATVVGMFNW